jgi:hypothetical protein
MLPASPCSCIWSAMVRAPQTFVPVEALVFFVRVCQWFGPVGRPCATRAMAIRVMGQLGG